MSHSYKINFTFNFYFFFLSLSEKEVLTEILFYEFFDYFLPFKINFVFFQFFSLPKKTKTLCIFHLLKLKRKPLKTSAINLYTFFLRNWIIMIVLGYQNRLKIPATNLNVDRYKWHLSKVNIRKLFSFSNHHF